MDKNAIKKFAVWARRELISRVSQRAAWYGITEKDPIDEKLQAIHGHVLTPEEQAQRRALIWHIRKNGYQQVMEEVAYTWFNRFIALRFMEVNGYLPSYTRVFSDENGAFNPQILKDAIHLDIEGLDMEKVYAMEEANETEALFKYLVIIQCNDLNRMLPGMFQKISDYTELLFPDFLLREGSVAHQMVTTIPEDDWKDAVQIIGWLYQYYNAEPKDEVFAALKKNIKISKEKIPAATQLFTPDWIVRYMVENSLGRLWVEGHPNDELKADWKYYLEEAPQEPEVEEQLKKIRAEYTQIDPASILCCDPCMGSGHILVYMFDVLMQIYLAYGYTTNEAVESIVRNNLWGMDIDDRAAQLAYFAVMMKAQQYDHRWLAKQVRHPVQANVFALQDSGDWPTFERQMRQAFTHHPSLAEDASIRTAKALFETFADAKEYGSIIQPEISLDELNLLENTLDEMAQKADLMDFVAQADAMTLMETLKPLILQCRSLVQKYHAVVTNPPYMGSGGMDDILISFLKEHFDDCRSDMFAVFMDRVHIMTREHGQFGMITQPSWLFLVSFEKMRKRFVNSVMIQNMLHMGRGIFGIDFGSVAFTMRKCDCIEYRGDYFRLHRRNFQYLNPIDIQNIFISSKANHTFKYDFTQYVNTDENELKTLESTDSSNSQQVYYSAVQKMFMEISSSPIAYWCPESMFDRFSGQLIGTKFDVKSGLSTGDNTLFVRNWYELSADNFTPFSQSGNWVPYNKGGGFRKWFGVIITAMKWGKNGEFVRDYGKAVFRNPSYYFLEGLTWTGITSGIVTFRYCPAGYIFDSNKGPMIFGNKQNLMLLLGYLNSNVANMIIKMLNPTVSVQIGDVVSVPYGELNEEDSELIERTVENSIALSQSDWDEKEVSWGFKTNPVMSYKTKDIKAAFRAALELKKERFEQLRKNETVINEVFIRAYELDSYLNPNVADDEITVDNPEIGELVVDFISFSVGCMFGRYSVDQPGLAFAGGRWDSSKYETFIPDKDAVIPICDDDYFSDDILGLFVKFIKTVFGEELLDSNLQFIADSLGGKGSAREVIRNYFLNNFYEDHIKKYQKCPIYWLFDSGKKNGFKCLIYMHRYQPDTIARIRTDYLHETQARYRNAIETLERQSANASTGERVKMTKRLNALKAQAEEARVYEEKIHHLADQMIKIDLDDGVKVNYAKFADVLAPIK